MITSGYTGINNLNEQDNQGVWLNFSLDKYTKISYKYNCNAKKTTFGLLALQQHTPDKCVVYAGTNTEIKAR